MLVNDGEMLVNDGDMSIWSYTHFTTIDWNLTIINITYHLGITTQWHYPRISIYEGAIITDALTGTSQAFYTSKVIHVQIHNVL